jgi:NADPH-dependent 2,4-dienoyl-CoA reductase/sulfur reductase-like enzyme
MTVRRREILKLLSASAATAAATSLGPISVAARRRPHRPPIECDVCIIGGGATGTYSAVQLIDAGKSVAVVERSGRLGGHCETYRDPDTGEFEDYGVVVYHDIPAVTDFCAPEVL